MTGFNLAMHSVSTTMHEYCPCGMKPLPFQHSDTHRVAEHLVDRGLDDGSCGLRVTVLCQKV
jgi:hypothetical protein